MFKTIVFVAIVTLAVAAPEPKAKPGVIAAAYTAPVVGTSVVGAPLAYSAPVVSAYSTPVVSSYRTYHGVAPAVAAYSAPVVYA